MKLSVLVIGLMVGFVCSQPPTELPSTCAAVSCMQGMPCKEVYNPSTSIISGHCLTNVTYTGNENVCVEGGQPLYKIKPDGSYVEVFCGRGLDRMDCPSGYECVIAPNDAYAVCCPVQTSEVEKPGVCPAPSGNMGICVFDPDVNCLTDSECDDDLKCCSEGCNKICKAPEATDKPGECPAPSGMAGACVFDPNVNCLRDTQCSGDEKCCSEGCNKICKAPASKVEKPGVCPAPSGNMGICVFDPDVNCLTDSECDDDFKCCSEGCNKVCKAPEGMKPGQCPTVTVNSQESCVFGQDSNCFSDIDCGDDLKCCSDGCSMVCTSAATTLKGNVISAVMVLLWMVIVWTQHL